MRNSLQGLIFGGLAALMLVMSLSVQAAPPPMTIGVDVEEFNGPMPNWANVRTFGAVGDGVADDTDAFQAAIDALGHRKVFGDYNFHPEFYVFGSPTTLYIPAGVYKITRSLSILHRVGVHFVGEDPATTRIKWGGSQGGTMLVTDGNLSGRFERLTWDGAGLAAIGVGHWFNSYKGLPGDRHGGSSHHVDEVFTDLKVGIYAGCCWDGESTIIRDNRPGTFSVDDADLRVNHKSDYINSPLAYWAYGDFGQLDSEGAVIRVRFIRNSVAGIQTGSPNALNWWIVDSRFEDCYNGLSNNPGAGNFLVYRSTFLRSTNADANIGNTGFFSMHGNFSLGSKQFFRAEESGNNGAHVILKNNRIITASDSNTPIYNGSLGPLVLIDNQIKSPEGSVGPVVRQENWEPGRHIFSIGNAFTVNGADQQIQMRYDSWSATYHPESRKRSVDDYVVARRQITERVPAAVSTPAAITRSIFTAAITSNDFVYEGQSIHEPVSTSAAIQSAVDAAVATGVPEGAIVYLPAARYVISAPIVVPSGKRIQIRGEGYNTVLEAPDNYTGQAVWILNGPSLVTLKDMWIRARSAKAVVVNNADQSGGQIYLSGYWGGTLNASGLLNTRLMSLASTGYSVATLSNVASFVSVGQNVGTIQAFDNSRIAIFDSWKEDSGVSIFQSDRSTTSILGGHFAMQLTGHLPTNSSDPSVLLDGFSGNFAFVASSLNMANDQSNNGITVSNEVIPTQGEPGTNALFLGVNSTRYGSFHRTGLGGNVGFVMMREANIVDPNLNTVPDVGDTSDARIRDGLSQIRQVEFSRFFNEVEVGATDLRIYRVFAPDTAQGLVIEGNAHDCLTSTGGVQTEGATSNVWAPVVHGSRPATVQECPLGGIVPTTITTVYQYVCQAGKIIRSSALGSMTVVDGSPACNSEMSR